MKNDGRSHIEELAHLYVDGAFDRRELLRRVAAVTGSLAAAAATVDAMGLEESAEDAQSRAGRADSRVPGHAHDLIVRDVQFPGETGAIFAHFARPRRARRAPALLVIHENRGLNEHIKDVTRRAARAGFVSLGIDLLSRFGGTPEDPEAALRLYGQTTVEGRLADMQSSLAYLQSLDVARRQKLGAVGFCAGGGNVWNLALNTAALSAAVPYYGAPVPALDALETLAAPVLAIYAELDRNLTRSVLAAAVRLEDLQKPFGLFVYEGTRHAFHNDTGANYDATAARDAWSRTTAFLKKYLD
jgi:carboxymethylenebutenolidase